MEVNILQFGAVADGITLSTKAIQNAIDSLGEMGGKVVVPAGHFRSGTIWLRSNVELHLAHGARLQGSDKMEDYNDVDAYPQNISSPVNEKWLGKHLIIALECENVAVTGTGTLDGNGDFFMGENKPWGAYVWNQGCRGAKDPVNCRPGQLLCFIECKRVLVENITITNQPCWGCYLHGCEYVSVRGLHTFNPVDFFNSDGLDIDCCRHVTVSDCIIDTGDDCIAIRGNCAPLQKAQPFCEYVTISNCVLSSSSSAIRLGLGAGTIRHIRISNLCITRGAPAVQIMSSYHGSGNTSIEDVSFSHITMTNCSRPVEIISESKGGACIKNITLQDIRAEVYGYIHFNVLAGNEVENICLKDFSVQMIDGPKPFTESCFAKKGESWFRASNVKGLWLENFSLEDQENFLAAWPKGPFAIQDCPQAEFKRVTLNGKPIEF